LEQQAAKGTVMIPDLAALARQYDAYESVDQSVFQRRARILQSMWREDQGFPIGIVNGRRYGARLEMPWAQDSLSNFIGDAAKNAVRNEVIDPVKSEGKLYGKPRIFDNLLSSQPLCFNLFAELQADLSLATAFVRAMGMGQVASVTAIEFEHSPGRGDPAYTGDRSAFDVFVAYSTTGGKTGFLGIEVKYHENLIGKAAMLRDRYEEVAAAAGCFLDHRLSALRSQPLQQIWRDHLLACSVLQHGDYNEGAFVFLYPCDNLHCASAVQDYRACLTKADTFVAWTLEDAWEAARSSLGTEWGTLFFERYLDFDRVMQQGATS